MSNCPAWSDDAVDSTSPDFKSALRTVLTALSADAVRRIVNESDVQRWHRALFLPYVPLQEYAGGFRQQCSKRPCLARDVAVDGKAGVSYRIVPWEMAAHFNKIDQAIRTVEVQWPRLTDPQKAIQVAKIAALLVGEFIRIHPFINGNGRTSRLLWRWALCRYGLPAQVRISPRPDDPYDSIMADCMVGKHARLANYILAAMARAPAMVGP